MSVETPEQCYICCTDVNLWSRVIRRQIRIKEGDDQTNPSFHIWICQDCYENKALRVAKPILPFPLPLSCLYPNLLFKASFLKVV